MSDLADRRTRGRSPVASGPTASLPTEGSPRANRSFDRAGWLLFCAAALAVLLTARWLTPSASGHGTHTQLGLPPCGLHHLASIPCPACGLTTSFAHMARLDVAAAVRAHPLGLVLFAITALAVPVSLVGWARALPIPETLVRLRLERLLLGVALLAVGIWAVRLAVALL